MKRKSLLQAYLLAACILLFVVVLLTVFILTGVGQIHSVFGLYAVICFFAFGDIIFWIKVIQIVIRKIKDKKAIENGIVYDATYISHTLIGSVKGVGLCKIIYSCNINGEIKEFTSDVEYSISEAVALEERKTFKVKVYGKHTVIVEDFKNIEHKDDIDYYLDKLYRKKKSKVKCEYCGSSYDNSLGKCPNCGSSEHK